MENPKGKLDGILFKVFSSGFCLFVVISFIIGFDPGIYIGQRFFSTTVSVLQSLPAALVLIGLFEAWIKDETVKNHLGEKAGFKGHFWAIALAGTAVGPLYISFPVAYAIRQKGARMGVVFTYINASAICRIPMAVFEASFLGLKFTAVRFIVSLPLVVLLSIALEKWFEKHEISGNHKLFKHSKGESI